MEFGSNNTSIVYHDIFDYKLTKDEAYRWQYKKEKLLVTGRKNKTRIQREKFSKKKLAIAKKAANLISKILTVKFVGITGALAMNNASKNSDIDLIIITSQNKLWITRFCVYYSLITNHFSPRSPSSSNEKDKLCLNMWLDENDLVWDKKERNIYTAHEIAQVVPLVNKDKTHEKFLYLNRWILNFWPNSVEIRKSNIEYRNKLEFSKFKYLNTISDFVLRALNLIAFKLQYFYMSKKITREIVTATRAIFHPNDWGSVVMKKLSSVK